MLVRQGVHRCSLLVVRRSGDRFEVRAWWINRSSNPSHEHYVSAEAHGDHKGVQIRVGPAVLMASPVKGCPLHSSPSSFLFPSCFAALMAGLVRKLFTPSISRFSFLSPYFAGRGSCDTPPEYTSPCLWPRGLYQAEHGHKSCQSKESHACPCQRLGLRIQRRPRRLLYLPCLSLGSFGLSAMPPPKSSHVSYQAAI